MHYSSEKIRSMLATDGQWPRRTVVELGPQDSAWNPASTKRDVYGPATVRYLEHVDGGFEAMVLA